MTNIRPSHIAYADETSYNAGRIRGGGLVTLPSAVKPGIGNEIRKILYGSNVGEFAWEKLSGARERFAAIKLIGFMMEHAWTGHLRIDLLVWDTEDRRHKIPGRDDIANLGRKYYHLFRNTLKNRWLAGSAWLLKPDENSAIDRATLQECLRASSVEMMLSGPLFEEQDHLGRLRLDLDVLDIQPSVSSEEPLIQLADLFVGMAIYSHERYERYV